MPRMGMKGLREKYVAGIDLATKTLYLRPGQDPNLLNRQQQERLKRAIRRVGVFTHDPVKMKQFNDERLYEAQRAAFAPAENDVDIEINQKGPDHDTDQQAEGVRGNEPRGPEADRQ
jgi:hypothetical protein